MKIIILGAGQVGGTLAAQLANERSDITVVDTDPLILRNLQDHLDIKTVEGPASLPSTLKRAGAEDAELIIAVTNSDEINIVACQVAHTIFSCPTKIARIRDQDYLTYATALFQRDHIPIDVIIGPEQLVTNNIKQLIANPGALQVLDFAEGLVQLVAVKAVVGGPIVGHQLKEIRDHMPSVDTRVAAIFRDGRPLIPEGDTVIDDGDEVFFVANRKHIRTVMSELRKLEKSYHKVMIAGGGNIGGTLALALESQYDVKIIEQDYQRCRVLSELMKSSLVLHGSASDSQLLRNEGIDTTDVFCALTNNDESNIMMSILAKRMGAKKVITLITNPSYAELIGDEIDVAISPQQITISSLLAYIRKGDISRVHSLRRGAAESLEIIARGDSVSSKVVGRRLDAIKLPAGTTIGAIVRGKQVLMAHKHIVIESEDHVILFVTDKDNISEIERLFSAGFGYFF